MRLAAADALYSFCSSCWPSFIALLLCRLDPLSARVPKWLTLMIRRSYKLQSLLDPSNFVRNTTIRDAPKRSTILAITELDS